MIAFTAVTALAAVAGVVVAQGQLKAMNDQLAEMRSSSGQTDRAIAAANRLAESAESEAAVNQELLGVARRDLGVYSEQLKSSQDTARRQLRPYLRLTLVVEDLVASKAPIAKLSISNSGPSSTYETSVALGIGIHGYPDKGEVRKAALSAPQSAVRTVIPPGLSSDMSVRLGGALSQSDLDELKRGNVERVYAWAVSTYRDSYGAIHHTYLCTSWRFDEDHWRGEVCDIGVDD